MTTPARTRYAGYRFPAEIIGHGVWLYFRFPLGLRMVEELLAARGIIVSHETVRQWARKFGQQFANQIRRRLPRAGDKWQQVVAMLSRIGPGDKTPREERELKKIVAGARNNDPDVLHEMWPTEQQVQELLARPWAREMPRTGAIAPVPFSRRACERIRACTRSIVALEPALHYKEF